MYTKLKPNKTTVKINKSYEGERIEQKINRILNNKEPIKDGAPLIYSERKDGVRPEYDIRTDRFEIAVEKMDYIQKSHIAKRNHRLGEQAKQNQKIEEKTETKKDGGTESAQTTDSK